MTVHLGSRQPADESVLHASTPAKHGSKSDRSTVSRGSWLASRARSGFGRMCRLVGERLCVC